MVNVLNCGIVVSEFELQSRHYVDFQSSTLEKGMSPLIHPTIGQIIPLLIFYKGGFDIKYPTRVDMPLNKINRIYDRPIGLMGRVFANGPGFNPKSSHTKNSKNGT